MLSRQIVARGLLDVLREFSDNENDFISVMETVARMSEDGGIGFVCLSRLFVLCLRCPKIPNVTASGTEAKSNPSEYSS